MKRIKNFVFVLVCVVFGITLSACTYTPTIEKPLSEPAGKAEARKPSTQLYTYPESFPPIKSKSGKCADLSGLYRNSGSALAPWFGVGRSAEAIEIHSDNKTIRAVPRCGTEQCGDENIFSRDEDEFTCKGKGITISETKLDIGGTGGIGAGRRVVVVYPADDGSLIGWSGEIASGVILVAPLPPIPFRGEKGNWYCFERLPSDDLAATTQISASCDGKFKTESEREFTRQWQTKKLKRQAETEELKRQFEEAIASITDDEQQSQSGVPEPVMVRVSAGSFWMGTDLEYGSEHPRHEVEIAEPFLIGRYEVTFNEYDPYILASGSKLPDDKGWGRGQWPVINVSWEDAAAYAEWLSKQTGKRYRLPTEAEWEYAARAGTETLWSFGDEEKDINRYGWYSPNAFSQTLPVGKKAPNPWGLYDVHGNVMEWVADCWHYSYKEAPGDGSAWLEANNGNCALRVVRGGSWIDGPEYLRSANRGWSAPANGNYSRGFRLVQDIE